MSTKMLYTNARNI